MSVMAQDILLVVGGFLAGFIDSIAGGGGLISLPLLLYLGLPTKLALGTNKIIGIAASSMSALRYGLSGNIQWKMALPALAAAFGGSILGALLAFVLSPQILRPVVLVGLFVVAIVTLTRKKLGDEARANRLSHVAWPSAFGFLMGAYDGFFGPGTGTFLMIGFVTLFGFSLLQASASARVVNFASNLGALLLFGAVGNLNLKFAILGALASASGSLVGSTLSIKKGAKFIRPVYLAVVWLLLLRLLFQVLTD